MRGWIPGRPVLVGAVLGLALLSGVTACGDDPAPTVGSGGTEGGAAPTGGAPEGGAPAGGTGTITVTADGKKYEFVTDDCSTVEVPAKIFSLSTTDATIELALPHDPGPFDQDSDGVIVPLTLGGSAETYQTVAFTGQRTEDGDRTSGTLSGTAKRATTGEEVEFSVDFSCPLVRG
ncbi:hypothetical protein GCM10022225_30820 [Plantactinospora mayteni]|uniref:Lipoprotein LpqH n=1 Tax=Plantactinospora mayteni TaxID=566021 RepID=A0ABQ4F3M0_9ACTN|nr:hypothetical protein [Plantactinospora mayteni]GIH01511.1 hypothetical protein Pma05_80830 [Plantactinospora mayteni]